MGIPFQPLVCHAMLCDTQEVEYVKQEAKLPYLLECLQKTPPPVCVIRATASDTTHVTVCNVASILWSAPHVILD